MSSSNDRECDDWLESFMQYTDNSEPPLLYRKWTAISTIASVLERKCYLEWGEKTFYPNMYIVLVGPSGKARKGTAMGVGHKMLREIGKTKLAAEAVTREALIRTLKEAEEQEIDAESGDVSYSASLTIYSEELTVFLGYHNVNLIADLTDWYDCRDHWTYRTKNMGTDDIVGIWVNMIGATTPDMIRSAIPQDAIGGGLSSRIIFVYEHNKAKTVAAPFLSEEDLDLRNRLINDLDRMHSLRGSFKITEEMLEKWIDWYPWQEQNPPFQNENFSGYLARRHIHALKLAMIMSAAARDTLTITRKDFEDALELLRQTEKNMPRTFSGMGRAPNAEVMGKIMNTIAMSGEVTTQELMRRHLHDVQDLKEFGDLLASLQKTGFCIYDARNGVVRYQKDSGIEGFE